MANFELDGGLSGEDAGEKTIESRTEGGCCYAKVERRSNVELAGLVELEGVFAEGGGLLGLGGGGVAGEEGIVACLGGFEGATGFLYIISILVSRKEADHSL